MRCQRCSGMMTIIHQYDEECSQNFLECLNCGEIIDQVILQNRKNNSGRFNFRNQPRRSFRSYSKSKSLSSR